MRDDDVGIFEEVRDTLDGGAAVIVVQDDRLAAALLAVGIDLWDNDDIRPWLHVKSRSGKVVVRYNFRGKNEEGDMDTQELCRAFIRGELDFIKANPSHPFTFALCALHNAEWTRRLRAEDCPNVLFRVRVPDPETGGTRPGTLIVKEGSKKHRAAIARGFEQV